MAMGVWSSLLLAGLAVAAVYNSRDLSCMHLVPTATQVRVKCQQIKSLRTTGKYNDDDDDGNSSSTAFITTNTVA